MPKRNRELKNRVREIRSHGSVRGLGRKSYLYSDDRRQTRKEKRQTADDGGTKNEERPGYARALRPGERTRNKEQITDH